ncbi:hypothetical protein AB4851_08810 [Burkholderia sp. 22PA0099]|uniref:hypothetical protein n=1 Tax=Burkholderia sp. 22PA0099 TaxID=3237372 RepID=UPI0039C2D1C3
MKKMMLLAAGSVAFAALALGACKSLPTPASVFAQSCPVVNADLALIGASPLLNQAQRDVVIQTILPANQKICAAGVNVDVSDLKAVHDSLLPLAVAIVQAVPLPNQGIILLALQSFGPIVQQLIDNLVIVPLTSTMSAAAAASDATTASTAVAQ